MLKKTYQTIFFVESPAAVRNRTIMTATKKQVIIETNTDPSQIVPASFPSNLSRNLPQQTKAFLSNRNLLTKNPSVMGALSFALIACSPTEGEAIKLSLKSPWCHLCCPFLRDHFFASVFSLTPSPILFGPSSAPISTEMH